MINPSLIRYPIDTTGIHPDNKIVNERHEVTPTMRTIIPRQGYFYGESLVIIRADKPLVLGVDYIVDDMNDDLTRKTGKAIMHSIIIRDDTIVGELSLTYQCYGSGDNFTRTHIAELVHQANARQDLHYKNIIGLPSRFLPSPHRHPVQETYGWRATVYLFDEMVRLLSHWKLDRDGSLYGTFSLFQDKVNEMLGGFRDEITRARETMGSVNDLDAKVDNAIEKIQKEVAAMSSLEDMQRLLDEMKRDIRDAYRQADSTLDADITGRYTAADTALGKRIDELTTTVNGLSTSDELNQRFSQYTPLATYNRDKETFALKTDVERIDTSLTQRPTFVEMSTAITEATRVVPWSKLSDIPRIWIDKNVGNDNKDFNTYTNYGTYYLEDMTHNAPESITNETSGILVVYVSSKDVWQFFKDKTGTEWSRIGKLSGRLVLRWTTWTPSSRSVKYINYRDTAMVTNLPSSVDKQTCGYYFYWGAMGSIGYPSEKMGVNGVPEENANYDWNAISIDGGGQHTILASAGEKLHFVYTKDESNKTTTERIITDVVMEQDFPRIWNVGKELDGLKTAVAEAANNTEHINQLRQEVGRGYVPLSRLQTSGYDHALDQLPKYNEGGILNTTGLSVGSSAENAKVFTNDNGAIQLNALFKPENIQLTSDANLKKDILPIENPEDIICGISGYKYRFKKDNREAVGVIAQEVELVLPEAVSKDSEGTRSVDYNAIVAVLVETVKSQQLTIDILKSRIEKLEKSMVD